MVYSIVRIMRWSFSLKIGVLYIRQKEDVVTFSGDKLSNGEKVTAVGTQVRFDEDQHNCKLKSLANLSVSVNKLASKKIQLLKSLVTSKTNNVVSDVCNVHRCHKAKLCGNE